MYLEVTHILTGICAISYDYKLKAVKDNNTKIQQLLRVVVTGVDTLTELNFCQDNVWLLTPAKCLMPTSAARAPLIFKIDRQIASFKAKHQSVTFSHDDVVLLCNAAARMLS